MALRIDDISLNTIIGNGTSIKGDLNVNGFVRVDGDIDGNLTTDGNIIIGENARIRGNVSAKAAVVGGIVIGDVCAKESVLLLSDSAVVGDVLSHKVQIEEEALINGHCISIKNDEEYERLSHDYLQSKAIQNKVYHS